MKMRPSIYQVFQRVKLEKRQWPNGEITKAPIWCGIDLSDGNQALPTPMDYADKMSFFRLLVGMGFKQIEVGHPGLCDVDYFFVEKLVNDGHIPDDVTIQVATLIKKSAIEKTFAAVKGAKNVIVHLYQSTSNLRRDEIYKVDANHVIERALDGVRLVKACIQSQPQTQFTIQYSPESFDTTQSDFLHDVCVAVVNEIKPSAEAPMILNLMMSVESDMPNYFADKVEWLISKLSHYPGVIFSVRAHNDRGTAVAAAELALLCGVTRIEGSLFANGERAGTTCLVTLGLNLYTLGIAPQLDFSCLNEVVAAYEQNTGMKVPKRHPYAGELSFSAFQAAHQFAIYEALKAYHECDKQYFHVPYLPMDPDDIGRGNDDVIRLSTHSGRTGIAAVMEKHHGYRLPFSMQKEFSALVKKKAGQVKTELSSEEVWDYFTQVYFKGHKPFLLKNVQFEKVGENKEVIHCHAVVNFEDQDYALSSMGNGALDTMVKALREAFYVDIDVDDYCQHALGHGSVATAVSYVRLVDEKEDYYWGVGVDSDLTISTLRALICGLNRKMENEYVGN